MIPLGDEPIGDPVYLDDFSGFVDTGTAMYGDIMDAVNVKGKWIVLRNMWGARNREVLRVGPNSDAPALMFRPGVTGRYAVYVGYFGCGGAHDGIAGIYVRLSTDPHYTRLVDERREPNYQEAYFTTVEFDRDLEIELADMRTHSALDYIKLVPVKQAGLPAPRGKLIGICDFMCSLGRAKPDGFEAGCCVRWHKEAGFDMLMWKAYSVRCEYHTEIGERRELRTDDGHIPPQRDTLREAVDEARKVGIEIYGWLRVNNEFSPRPDEPRPRFGATTPFHRDHPDMRIADKTGRLTPRLGFAFPEARRHKIDIMCEVAGYGVDGIFIDVLRHPPVALYDLPLVEAFLAKTGEDPREMDNDGSEAWLRFRADASFTQFLREARAALDEKRGKDFPVIVRTVDQVWRNLQIGCDVQTWIDEKLVNGILFAPHVPSADFTPQKLDMQPYIEMSQGAVDIYAQVWRMGSITETLALAGNTYAQGVRGVAIYESEFALQRGSIREQLWRLKRPETF